MKTELSPSPCKWRLAAALVVAALWSDIWGRAAYRRIWRALTLFAGAWRPGAEVGRRQYNARLATCQRCRIWFAPLRTCSTPLRSDMREFGCWCNMEAKARLREATCWMDDECGREAVYGWRQQGVE